MRSRSPFKAKECLLLTRSGPIKIDKFRSDR